MSSKTIPEIFILESLRLDDEADRSQEGELLSRMLRLSGKAALPELHSEASSNEW
jgi:hypothetical protein